MKISDDNIGCGILGIVFVIFIIVISLLTKKWDKDSAYANELIAAGDSCFRNNNIADAINYYSEAFDVSNIDSLASTLMKCEYMIGNKEAALNWLDEIGRATFQSDLIELHRNHTLFSIHKDTSKYVSALDSMLNVPVRLTTSSFIRKLWDMLIAEDINYTQDKYYDRYYFDYYAKLMVLYNRINMCRTYEEFISIGEYIFKLTDDQEDDYAYINDYLREGKTTDYELKKHEKFVLNTGLDPTYTELSYLERTANFKWFLFDIMLASVHQVHGYEAALEYANKITCNNSLNADTDFSYNKFIYGIYSGITDSTIFPTSLTRSELDTILTYSSDKNGRIPFARAFIACGRFNPFANHKFSIEKFRTDGDIVHDPVVILETDFWNWKEQNDPFIFSDEGINISYISDIYTASDSKICCNVLSVDVYPIITTLYAMNLLQAEYNKQTGLPVFSSIVDLKSLLNDTQFKTP